MQKNIWLREGTTVYTLMHHGWSKGEEQFRNRLWFGVQRDHATVTEAEAEEAAAFIVKAVNAHQGLVSALRAALDSLEYAQDSLSGTIGCGVRADRIKAARAALAAAGE